MTDDAIVQAAAEALTYTAPNGELVLGWPDLRCEVSEWEREQLARAVLAVVDPLIRADQREKDAALIEAHGVQALRYEAAHGHDLRLALRRTACLVRMADQAPPGLSALFPYYGQADLCPDGPHRGPEGPNEDITQCAGCGSVTYVMRPPGETFGDHLPDCALPISHESYCQPGGSGHPRAEKIRG